MYLSPDSDTYDVGTVVTCFADAFPFATYYWQNLDTARIYNAQSFIISEDMVGQARMRCHAENVIAGVQYFNDLFTTLTVNRKYIALHTVVGSTGVLC